MLDKELLKGGNVDNLIVGIGDGVDDVLLGNLGLLLGGLLKKKIQLAFRSPYQAIQLHFQKFTQVSREQQQAGSVDSKTK